MMRKSREQWIPQRSHRVYKFELNECGAVGPGEIAPTAINFGAFFWKFFIGYGNFILFLNWGCHAT